MITSLKNLLVVTFAKKSFPYLGLFLFFVSLVFRQYMPESITEYHRDAFQPSGFWRIWTSQLTHFGWSHWFADAWLFLLLMRILERRFFTLMYVSAVLLPITICGVVYIFDPTMTRYAGLSGVNVGLLIFLTLYNWKQDKFDWFWPAILVVHVVELVLEARSGGTGGAMVQFNDTNIRVATIAHIAGVFYGILMFVVAIFGYPKVKST